MRAVSYTCTWRHLASTNGNCRPDAKLYLLVGPTRYYWPLCTGFFDVLCDPDLDPMTFMYELDAYYLEIHRMYSTMAHPSPKYYHRGSKRAKFGHDVWSQSHVKRCGFETKQPMENLQHDTGRLKDWKTGPPTISLCIDVDISSVPPVIFTVRSFDFRLQSPYFETEQNLNLWYNRTSEAPLIGLCPGVARLTYLWDPSLWLSPSYTSSPLKTA